jgi:hypothetical protein
MWSGIIILAVIAAVGLGGLALLALLARFLTSDPGEDEVMRFDPFATTHKPVNPFLGWILSWRFRRPRQLTYRRDRRGRFRKTERF